MSLQQDLGPFDLDLVADRGGLMNPMAAHWCCAESSGFCNDIRGWKCWAHPQRDLVLLFLQHVNKLIQTTPPGSIKVAILIPVDSGAPWFKTRVLEGHPKKNVCCQNGTGASSGQQEVICCEPC